MEKNNQKKNISFEVELLNVSKKVSMPKINEVSEGENTNASTIGNGLVSTRLSFSAETERSHCHSEDGEVELDEISSSLDREVLDFHTALGNGKISPNLERSLDEVETEQCSQNVAMYLMPSEDSDVSETDDDLGEDYTVSKYMESKILDKSRFGVWRVEKTERESTTLPNSESWEDEGGSREPRGTWKVNLPPMDLAPLRLTLKKALPTEICEEVKPKKGKTMKKKHNPIHSDGEDNNSHQPRKRGRPPTNITSNPTTRQRLMNMFKKKYFKDRKRWSRRGSTCSMPPTIRSIAKS